ncbi:hypothetical protein Tco_1304714 [Tanacetum coccineum]
METKDTLSSCSYSDEQDMQQLKLAKILKGCFLNGLSALQSKFHTGNLNKASLKLNLNGRFSHIFGEDVDHSQEHYMLKIIILAQTIQKRLDDKKLQIQECTVQEVKALDAISEDKAKKELHGTMFLNVDQLEKQLDKEEFQEIGSTTSFKVLETQFQMFIKSRMYLDDEFVVMTCNYFLQYTQLAIPEFRDTLIQHMESVKKSIDERAQHKREYDSWVNERQIQTTEGKIDTGKAVDASLVNTESIGTESKEQDTSSRSGNDAHADDADIRPIYDEEPMVEVQTTAEINIFATGQQHTEQPEFNNEGEVDQNAEQCHDTCPLPAHLTDNHTTELSNQSLESKNICLKKTVA